MRKIFSKEIFLIITPLLLVSLFIFPKNSYALTTSWEVSDTTFTTYNNDISTLTNYANTYISNNPSYTTYYIIQNNVDNYYSIFFYSSSLDLKFPSYAPNYFNFYTYTVEECQYNFSDLSLISCSTNYNTANGSGNLLYSYNYLFKTNGNTNIVNGCSYDFTITNNSNSYSFGQSSSCVMPTIEYLNDLWFSTPPIPPDPYPLLTSFFTITLEKLSVITEFISSNYLYLTPFVIFIIYFVILMFRRLK